MSVDSAAVQRAFCSSLGNIPYPVLADFHPKGNVCQLYDVYNYRRGTADRAVFVIDKAGTVRWKRVYASAKDVDLNEILAEIDRL